MEKYQRKNRTKDMFATVNRLTKQACTSVKSVKSESGETLTEQDEITNRWKNYCETLYSTCKPVEEMRLDGVQEPTATYEEVEKAIKSMRTGKAEGADEIPAELLKLGGETVTGAMHNMITHVWITGNWPDDWTQSTFVPLFKKGDPTVCANYRTMSLISHASKVLLKVIVDRMRDKVEFEVAEEQAGFRPNRGITEHLCNLRLITERARARRQPLYLCFIDFEKAFDMISHKKLWKGMLSMGFAPHLVSLIKSLYEMQKSNVRAAGGKSDWFNVMKGVRQGCLLSPYLFNIMCEVLMRLALEGFESGFKIGGRLVTNLRYADDIVLIASNEKELQEIVSRLHWAACEMSMKINVKKTEVMKVDADLTPIKVTVAGVYLRQVHSFKNLGAYFNSDAICTEEIKSILAIGRERMAQLNTLWSRAISNPLKARLIQSLIWPIVTYGADAWTLNKELTGNEAFEMQCYRRSMKVPYTEHVTNETILERVKRYTIYSPV